MTELPVKFPVELDTAYKTCYVVSRILNGASLIACICSAWEQYSDWALGRQHENRIHTTLSRPMEGSTSIVTRLLFFQNVSFAVFSVATAFGTLPMPKDVPPMTIQHQWGVAGNQTTCDIQGSVATMSFLATLCFDLCLSCTYLLMVLYGWKETSFRRIEKHFHIFSWGLPAFITVAGLVSRNYNANIFCCRLAVERYECVDLRKDGMCYETEVHERGDGDTHVLIGAVAFILIVVHLLMSIYVMARIIKYALFEGLQPHVSRRIAIKASMYVSVIVIAQLPFFVSIILLCTGKAFLSKPIFLFFTMALPLAGLNNLYVFMWKRDVMRTPLGRFLKDMTQRVGRLLACSCCCTNIESREDARNEGFVRVGRDLFAVSDEEEADARPRQLEPVSEH